MSVVVKVIASVFVNINVDEQFHFRIPSTQSSRVSTASRWAG